MVDETEALKRVFSKNRTEELGYDVWEHFVVPPFYDRLDLHEARKPRLVIGGRGCGKTMLLRYLSHQSSFSPHRPEVPEEALGHIGLYWRVDTQFARVMTGRSIPDDTWMSAFEHLVSLVLGGELVRSIGTISRSSIAGKHNVRLEQISFRRLARFDESMNCPLPALEEVVKRKLTEFEIWVANVRKVQEPIFLPGRSFLMALIEDVKEHVACLNGSVFFVYLDEFENLLEYQQEVINTYLKHSEAPLLFNVATKRHGFTTTKTIGEESINNIADYRMHDLEEYILEGNFPLFAAEVLFHNLALAGLEEAGDISNLLRNTDLLEKRRDPAHKEKVLERARRMFPSTSHAELAQSVLSDDSLYRRLVNRIEKSLRAKRSTISAEQFIRSSHPQATVLVPALLSRAGYKPREVLAELDRLEAGEQNRFTGKTDWIHNNFIGALLSLYESHPRACPFYAGFDTFCHLSRGNLRHFLELCHKSLNQIARRSAHDPWIVSPTEQAHAARQASADFLGEIRSFGRLGNRLHTFVLRLGSLFALAQSRPTLSEPEQCHFSVTRGKPISEEDNRFLREAVKWSVLFEEEATKVKSDFQEANFEYVLNPIYAPYFHISYRKRRRLEITSEELHILAAGTYEEVAKLLKQYSEKWSVSLPDANQLLFSHLFEA